MPIPAPVPALHAEQLLGFVGVNLRHDPLSTADTDVVRAINADLHSEVGTVRRRRGREALWTEPLAGPVRRLGRYAGRRYAVAGSTVYRDEVPLSGGRSAQELTTLLAARGLTDTQTWVFIADQALMQKDSGTGPLDPWGMTFPQVQPTLVAGGAGGLTGAYKAGYTYARVSGVAVAAESNLLAANSPAVLVAQTLQVSVVASPDPQVTHIRLYRTLADGAQYFFDQMVANGAQTLTSSVADSGLGAAAPLAGANNPPPLMSWVTAFQGHVFGCNRTDQPTRLQWSTRWTPESWPPDQYVDIGLADDPLQCAVPLTGILGVFSRTSKYRVFGNATSGFAWLEALNTRGTPAPWAVLATSRGVGVVARDGVFVTNFVQEDTYLSEALEPLFDNRTVHDYAPVDWSHPEALALAEYRQRLYFGYTDTTGRPMLAVYSQATQKWYFYANHPVRSLVWDEHSDQLWLGGTDGRGWQLEVGETDGGEPIACSVFSRELAHGERWRYKAALYLKVDAQVPPDGAATLTLVCDGVARQTWTLTGGRSKTLLRCTDALLYHTAHLTWQTTADAQLYGVLLLARPLEESGHA